MEEQGPGPCSKQLQMNTKIIMTQVIDQITLNYEFMIAAPRELSTGSVHTISCHVGVHDHSFDHLFNIKSGLLIGTPATCLTRY